MPQFNIEPGMTIWFDQPEEYKKAYFDNQNRKRALLHNKVWRPEYKMITNTFFRVFDPLKPVSGQAVHCAFHIPVHVEDRERDSDSKGMIEDFIVSRRAIELFREYTISNLKSFRLDLVVSVNGNITNKRFIDYFESINNKWLQPGKVLCKVFQRPNVGFQWGGYHDMWMRYKDKCNWFATMEADHRLMYDNWYDRILEYVGDGSRFTYGKSQTQKEWDPKRPLGVLRVPDNCWRNSDGSNRNATRQDMVHTCGAFHFCHNSILTKLDNAFGCFTFSMGCDHKIDGIIQGEIGFCQKIKSFGYDIRHKEMEFLVRPMRGADCEYNPNGDHNIVAKEVAEWGI